MNTDKDHETIASRIRRLRTELGLSQWKLADAAKINRENVIQWEHNRSLPSVTNLTQLARAFKVSLDYLVCQTDVRAMSTTPVYQIRSGITWTDCSEHAYNTTELERRILYK